MANLRDSIILSYQNYYKTNVSSLILFAKRFVPLDVAEDIVHDVFLEAWNYWKNNAELPARSYLFTAVRNRCINFLKRENVKQNYLESLQTGNQLAGLVYYDSEEKLLIDRENMQQIHNEIEKLPDKCRVIFKMAYMEDKKSIEIAETLHISVRTVEHQLYLGLKTIRSKLTRKGKHDLFFLLFF